MGTPTEWFEVFVYLVVSCTLFAIFLEPFGPTWRGSSRAKLTLAFFLFSSGLVLGISNSFGRRAFHGGLFWISSASALTMLASGIMFRRMRRRDEQKSPD